MIIAPLWVIVIIIAVGVTIKLLTAPARQRKASERRQLFVDRNLADTPGAEVTFVDLKSVRAKRLLAGAFTIDTSLGPSDVAEALVETCDDFPRKKTVFGMNGPIIKHDERLDQDVVAYGSVAPTKMGGETVVDPDWCLALRGSGEGAAALAVARVKGTGGEVNEVEEMAYFVIEFERHLRTRDASAATAVTFQH